jgi:hypothetical protein
MQSRKRRKPETSAALREDAENRIVMAGVRGSMDLK